VITLCSFHCISTIEVKCLYYLKIDKLPNQQQSLLLQPKSVSDQRANRLVLQNLKKSSYKLYFFTNIYSETRLLQTGLLQTPGYTKHIVFFFFGPKSMFSTLTKPAITNLSYWEHIWLAPSSSL